MSFTKNMKPMVSVIIPTYNRIGTIRRAIESALTQTYSELEVIVVDDGSTDGTRESLEQYGDRIKFILQANAGPSAARNRGVREARSAMVAFLDSDDVWLPEKIQQQMEVMLRGGDSVCCCICNSTLQASTGLATTSFKAAGITSPVELGILRNPGQIISSRFLLFNQVVLIRRDVFERLGGFNEDLWLLEDHDLALRLATQGQWGIVSKPLVIKCEEVDSLGGAARMDPALHLSAVVRVLRQFLEGSTEMSEQLRRDVISERGRLRAAIRAHELAESKFLPTALHGRARLLIQRIRNALRRRSSSWPKADIVAL